MLKFIGHSLLVVSSLSLLSTELSWASRSPRNQSFQQLERIAESTRHLRQERQRIKRRLPEVQAEIDRIGTELESTRQILASTQRFSPGSARLQRLRERIVELENSVITTANEYSSLQNRLRSINSSVAWLQTRQTSLSQLRRPSPSLSTSLGSIDRRPSGTDTTRSGVESLPASTSSTRALSPSISISSLDSDLGSDLDSDFEEGLSSDSDISSNSGLSTPPLSREVSISQSSRSVSSLSNPSSSSPVSRALNSDTLNGPDVDLPDDILSLSNQLTQQAILDSIADQRTSRLRSAPQQVQPSANGQAVTNNQQAITVPQIPTVITVDQATNFLHEEAKQTLKSRLQQNYILRDQTRSGIRPVSLVQDFEEAKQVVDSSRSRLSTQPYKVNLAYLSADPYLSMHNVDYDLLYPEAIQETEWAQLFQTLARTLDDNQLRSDLSAPFIRTNPVQDDSADMVLTKQLIRKRIKRLFDKAVSDGNGELRNLALHLISNSGRCLDGLQDGLTAVEAVAFKLDQPLNFGDFISRVLTEYKMDFIKKHAELNASSEFQTTAVQVLRQRMLYSLNLKGRESQISYIFLGNPEDPALQPGAVMHRFLFGGSARLRLSPVTVQFPAFTVDKMVSLLSTSFERGFVDQRGIRIHRASPRVYLKASLFQKFSMEEPVLKDFFEKVAVLFEEERNAFFQKAPDSENQANIRVTEKFWLYLLEKYGYILKG